MFWRNVYVRGGGAHGRVMVNVAKDITLGGGGGIQKDYITDWTTSAKIIQIYSAIKQSNRLHKPRNTHILRGK